MQLSKKKEIKKIIIQSNSLIKDVINNLNNSRLKITLIVDKNNKLIGTIVDGDIVDASNLHRQILYNEGDIGAKKAEIAAKKLIDLNSQISIDCISEFIDKIRLELNITIILLF